MKWESLPTSVGRVAVDIPKSDDVTWAVSLGGMRFVVTVSSRDCIFNCSGRYPSNTPKDKVEAQAEAVHAALRKLLPVDAQADAA